MILSLFLSFFKKKTTHLEKLCILLMGGGSEGLLLNMTFMAIWIWAFSVVTNAPFLKHLVIT